MPEVARRDHASTEQLSALLDNRAESTELPFLTNHIVTCEACQRELSGLRAVRDLLRQLPIQVPPRAFTISPARPATRFRRLVPLTRVLSAIAAVFCVLLFSVDAMGTGYDSAPIPRLQSALRSDSAPKAADSAQAVTGVLPTMTAPPAAAVAQPAARPAPPPASEAKPAAPAAAKPAAPAAAAKPVEPAPAAPPPATAYSPGNNAPSAASSAPSGRSADGPLAAPSGAGAAPQPTSPTAAPAAPAPPAAAAPTAAPAESRSTATTIATMTPSAPPTAQAAAQPTAPPSQNVALLGLSPLRTASFVLGLLAVGLFIGSVLLKRVALAPLDLQRDGFDR